ncbi:hypothetical protein MAL1_00251 [Bacteriophage DSS3_MAL1]|nr:hypothetical protein MAL1_00251 [Bacteriophage DSS3_MAL1]
MKAFDGTPVATIRSTDTGIPFTMRLVRIGDGYGRDLALTHDKNEPLVEFYDARYACDPTKEKGGEYGQFVSRYYVSTLFASPSAESGLNLEGSVDAWSINRDGMQSAFAILRNWLN